MELKDVTAEMGDTPQPDIVEADSDSQAEEVVVEEPTQVEEVNDQETEEVPSEGETPKEDTEAEADVPFFEKPGVKERIDGIREKYESKAAYWDTIAEISQNDPEFRLVMLQRLENAGKVAPGTTEKLRTEMERTQSSAQQESEYLQALPPEIQEDVKALREFRMQQENERVRREAQVEEFLENFEKDKPDIASSPNPARTRNTIFNMANELVDRGEKDFAKALERAYRIVLHPDSITSEAREAGQIEGVIQASQEAASGVTSGGGKPGKPVKLTQEERRAAELIGMTPEEYRRYKDAGEELFENL